VGLKTRAHLYPATCVPGLDEWGREIGSRLLYARLDFLRILPTNDLPISHGSDLLLVCRAHCGLLLPIPERTHLLEGLDAPQ
jgi:hypothetical protein